MILATNLKYEIGKIIDTKMTDYNGDLHQVRVMIMGESNREEYLEETISELWPLERLQKTKAYNCDYFYLVSMD